jgi:alginate O-acetyltransferase complex protein AlgI
VLFNSFTFIIFLIVVFACFWSLNRYKLSYQNILILLASYVFYGWWDWRFLTLIVFSTIVDYYIGLLLFKIADDKKRKILLWVSISINLGLLGFFKYFNFFIENFIIVTEQIGWSVNPISLSIILPVGISFYTFQTLSYTIDIYNRRFSATKDFIAFAAFISFFPQLVAGPIERAKDLLPQFLKKRYFNYQQAIDGCRQILWGFFKKIVIADTCAIYANDIFNHHTQYSGSTLALGAFFFTIQIYGDFSGYSDIAIGLARLFGFKLKQNFAFPYFSRNIAEFWRRWHISLSTWFRDYLYIPLGGSRGGVRMSVRNTFIVFLVSGFWHGANWTFIFWGALHALLFLPLLLRKQNRTYQAVIGADNSNISNKEILSMLLTFMIVVLAWVFFRATSLNQAVLILSEIFSISLFDPLAYNGIEKLSVTLSLIGFFFMIEWLGRNEKFALEKFLLQKSRTFRYTFYILICFVIFWFSGQEQSFIYFQF